MFFLLFAFDEDLLSDLLTSTTTEISVFSSAAAAGCAAVPHDIFLFISSLSILSLSFLSLYIGTVYTSGFSTDGFFSDVFFLSNTVGSKSGSRNIGSSEK